MRSFERTHFGTPPEHTILSMAGRRLMKVRKLGARDRGASTQGHSVHVVVWCVSLWCCAWMNDRVCDINQVTP